MKHKQYPLATRERITTTKTPPEHLDELLTELEQELDDPSKLKQFEQRELILTLQTPQHTQERIITEFHRRITAHTINKYVSQIKHNKGETNASKR